MKKRGHCECGSNEFYVKEEVINKATFNEDRSYDLEISNSNGTEDSFECVSCGTIMTEEEINTLRT